MRDGCGQPMLPRTSKNARYTPRASRLEIVGARARCSSTVWADVFEKFSARIRGEKPPVGPSNHSREAKEPGVSSFDEGQRPSHGLRCGHQYDRGCEHQTQQTK